LEEERMKKLMMLGAMIAVFGLGTAAALAGTPDTASSQASEANDQVCPEGDSGKIDVSGNNASLTLTASEGKLIVGYCVKAGSANQGLGPEFYTVDPPAKTVTISHSSGKDISHYSLTFVDDEAPPTETTPTDTTPTETTPTETTPTETTPTESTPTETTTTESTPTETTPTTTPAEPNQTGTTPSAQGSFFTPPTSQKPAKAAPAVVASVNASATTPSKAAQAAPFTP
jgi:cell division septation protein DedD